MTELIVALDFPKADSAHQLVKKLEGLPVLYKVGLELFLSGGPSFVKDLVHGGHRVFLDLKLHDIPNTVAHAVIQAAFLKCEMLTVHATVGSKAFQESRRLLDEIPDLKPKMLGVTVLTSFDDFHWSEVTHSMTGHSVSASYSVHGLASKLEEWGCDGVVCSAHELEWIKKNHPKLYTVVPGIRPAQDSSFIGGQKDDQARVVTPAQAAAWGADAIVVGRPITKASNPREIAEQILAEIHG